jgi:hypothetical protein
MNMTINFRKIAVGTLTALAMLAVSTPASADPLDPQGWWTPPEPLPEAQAVDPKDVEMCWRPNQTNVPCAELGTEFTCDKSEEAFYIDHQHLLSDTAEHIIRIQALHKKHRKGKPIVIRYDLDADKLTVNGGRCRPVCRGRCE